MESMHSNLSNILDVFLPSRFFGKSNAKPLEPSSDRISIPVPVSPPIPLSMPAPVSSQIPILKLTSTPSPNPLEFFVSKYMIGLILIVVLLHRIRRTVVPRPIHPQRHHQSHARSLFTPRVLPLDLSYTPTRLALHLPTLYFLIKVLLLWGLIVLQTSGVWNIEGKLGRWAREKEMREVCWSTFCAICVAFCVEGFVRALDGRQVHQNGPFSGTGESMNTSPFNLLGYAILLHSYASPSKHINPVPGSSEPTRPEKHAVITIAIPLIQLTLLHIFSISKRHSNHRLIPTALTSILSLTHFHLTLLSYFFSPAPVLSPRKPPVSPTPSPTHDFLNPIPAPPYRGSHTLQTPPLTPFPSPSPIFQFQSIQDQALLNNHTAFISSTKPTSRTYIYTTTYPTLNYIPNIFESLLILSIALSTVLNLLARLLVTPRNEDSARYRTRSRRQGRRRHNQIGNSVTLDVSSPQNNSFTSHLRTALASLPYDQDFGVVLLRLGIRSLDGGGISFGSASSSSTGRGWANEVGGIYLGLRDNASRGRIHGSRQGAISGSTYPMAALGGLHNEITPLPPSSTTQTILERLGLGWVDTVLDLTPARRGWGWIRFVGRVCVFLVRGLWNFGRRVWKNGWRGWKRQSRGLEREHTHEEHVDEDTDGEAEGEMEDLYNRFLKGDMFESDDEDEAYRDRPSLKKDVYHGRDTDSSSEEDLADYGAENRTWDGRNETLELLGEFIFGNTRELHSSTASEGPSSSNAVMASSRGTGGMPRDEAQLVLSRLLTHRQDENSRVMTRGQWRVLAHNGAREIGSRGTGGNWARDEDGVDRWIEERRAVGIWRRDGDRGEVVGKGGKEREEEDRDWCVVCMSAGREVICWPCRCLAMCNECREALALQSAAGKHRCPCCRRSVEGFSRIYVP